MVSNSSLMRTIRLQGSMSS